MKHETIYVRLVDEAVDVWRPIAAQRVDESVYRILEQPYDRSTETWEFSPGEHVICRHKNLEDVEVLAAVSRSDGSVLRPSQSS